MNLLLTIGICLLLPFFRGLGYAMAGEILDKYKYIQKADRYLLTSAVCGMIGAILIGVGLW